MEFDKMNLMSSLISSLLSQVYDAFTYNEVEENFFKKRTFIEYKNFLNDKILKILKTINLYLDYKIDIDEMFMALNVTYNFLNKLREDRIYYKADHIYDTENIITHKKEIFSPSKTFGKIFYNELAFDMLNNILNILLYKFNRHYDMGLNDDMKELMSEYEFEGRLKEISEKISKNCPKNKYNEKDCEAIKEYEKNVKVCYDEDFMMGM